MYRIPRPGLMYVAVLAQLLLTASLLNAQATKSPTPASPQNLTCSPAPCVFPNVRVSQGGYFFTNQIIVSNPNDPSQLLIGAEDMNCNNSLIVGIFSSQDAGTSWAHDCLPRGPLPSGGGAPIAGYDDNNVVYAGGSDSDPAQYLTGTVVSSSTDNGQHWSTPVTAIDQAYPFSLKVDANPGSPFEHSIYITAARTEPPNNTYVVLAHSTDGGKTWSSLFLDRANAGIAVGPGDLAVAKNGTVYITWIRCKFIPEIGCINEHIMFSVSADGGNTWSTPSEIANTRIETLTGIYMYPYNVPVIAVDNSSQPTAGNLYIAFPRFNRNRTEIGVVISKDGGNTWSSPAHVSASRTGDQFQHWISVAANGTVGVTWLDRRLDGYHYQPYYSISRDGGAHFTGDLPLSQTLSDPAKGISYSTWYRTHVWVDNAIYAIWNETNTGSLQIVLGGVQF